MKKFLNLVESSIFYGPSKSRKMPSNRRHFVSRPRSRGMGPDYYCDVYPGRKRVSGTSKFTGKLSFSERVRFQMPSRCVAGGCSNIPDLENGIVLHTIPYFGDERPQAKKRRKKWVDFVKSKRAKWEPTKNSAVCSVHFKPDDFQRLFSNLPGQSKPSIPRLNRDDFGVAAFPSIHAVGKVIEPPQSKRSKRKVR